MQHFLILRDGLHLDDVRKVISEELPGCEFKMGLYYRYLLRWKKNSCE